MSKTILHSIQIRDYLFDLTYQDKEKQYVLMSRNGKAPFKVNLINPTFPRMEKATQADFVKLAETINSMYLVKPEEQTDGSYQVQYEVKSLGKEKRVSPKRALDDPHTPQTPQTPTQKVLAQWREMEEKEEHSVTTKTPKSSKKGTTSPKEEAQSKPYCLSCYKVDGSKTTLINEIQEFLKDGRLKVLNLLGDPGCNLATYCQYLKNLLEQEHKGSKVLHIKVTIEDKKKDDTKLVVNAVQKMYSLKDSEDVYSLRDKNDFIFIVEGAQMYANFFGRNNLSKWPHAHTIFVSNSLTMSGDPKERAGRMAPPASFNRSGPIMMQYRELTLSHLDEKQIISFWKDYPKYQKQIDNLGLKPLLFFPLFLEIIQELLPTVSPTDKPETIWDKIIDESFIRQGDRELKGKKLCIKLAKAMPTDVVEYEPTDPDYEEDHEFEEFFGSKNQSLLAISPLKREGENGFCFLDPSLKKYFAAQILKKT